MRIHWLAVVALFFLGSLGGLAMGQNAASLAEAPQRVSDDWLVKRIEQPTVVHRGMNDREIVLSNGLISRTFRIAPNAATVAFDNLMTGESLLRGVKPEAMLRIDGIDIAVGGLVGQPNYAFLRPDWLEAMKADDRALQFDRYAVGSTKERFAWKRVRHADDLPWPPPGAALTIHFKPSNAVAGRLKIRPDQLDVAVHYEMYDGIPLLAKWMTVRNTSDRDLRLESFTVEQLAVVEYESAVDPRDRWEYPNLYVGSDYAFRGMDPTTSNRTVQWVTDPQYSTQVNYERRTPNLLVVKPPLGPDVMLKPGETFETFRAFELVHDSTERERKGLAMRRMYRTLAPWVTENPPIMHVRSARPDAVRLAIDQSADVGFEMVIMTFGSGFNIESEDPAYIQQIKELVEYAKSKGVELGGYSLLASRSVGAAHDIIDPKTGKQGGGAFGNSPCLCSVWGQRYFEKLYTFFEATGMHLLEHDGSYPGDVCASTNHPGHRGLNDSQWQQWKTISDFYKWARGRGIYLNVPDFYFLVGQNKVAMGYRETNWSLPRDQQIIHARQNIYDGTWEKTPSMGWMFVPLVEYHGGGAAATLEPLSEHLDAYEAHLANLFGSGVQACFRGPRLYDTPETRAVVKKWVDFYKKYRAILESDLIHVRRADGRDLDCMMHVNPHLPQKALAMVWNPLDQPVTKTLRLPLYYTGLTDKARIREQEGEAKTYTLQRDYSVEVEVTVPANGATWLVVE